MYVCVCVLHLETWIAYFFFKFTLIDYVSFLLFWGFCGFLGGVCLFVRLGVFGLVWFKFWSSIQVK